MLYACSNLAPKYILYIKSLSLCVRACVCDGGRREKWREKEKMTVGWRAFEVLKPRSWEGNAVSVYWGFETQVLRVKCSYAGLQARADWADCVWPSHVHRTEHRSTTVRWRARSWNPGPESQMQQHDNNRRRESRLLIGLTWLLKLEMMVDVDTTTQGY